PSLALLAEAFAAVAWNRTLNWQAMAQSDPSKRAAIEAKILENRQVIIDTLKKYEPLISDEKDRAMLAEDRAALDEFAGLRERSLVLVNQGKAKEAQELVFDNQKILARVWK